MQRVANLMLAIATALAMSPGPWVSVSQAAGYSPDDRGSSVRASLPDWVSRVPEGVPICGVTVECCGFCCVTEEPSERDQRPAAPMPERSPVEWQPSPWGHPLPPGSGVANHPGAELLQANARSEATHGMLDAAPSTASRLSTVCRRLT